MQRHKKQHIIHIDLHLQNMLFDNGFISSAMSIHAIGGNRRSAFLSPVEKVNNAMGLG